MRTILSLVALAALVAPSSVSAQGAGRFDKPGHNEMDSRLTVPALPQLARTESGQAATQKNKDDRNWVGRHPVVFGLLVGTGAGAALGAASVPERHNPDVTRGTSALMGAVAGAGFGALAGFIVASVRD